MPYRAAWDLSVRELQTFMGTTSQSHSCLPDAELLSNVHDVTRMRAVLVSWAEQVQAESYNLF